MPDKLDTTHVLMANELVLYRRPKVSSVPFFLSYFWQVQLPERWAVYYTNTFANQLPRQRFSAARVMGPIRLGTLSAWTEHGSR